MVTVALEQEQFTHSCVWSWLDADTVTDQTLGLRIPVWPVGGSFLAWPNQTPQFMDDSLNFKIPRMQIGYLFYIIMSDGSTLLTISCLVCLYIGTMEFTWQHSLATIFYGNEATGNHGNTHITGYYATGAGPRAHCHFPPQRGSPGYQSLRWTSSRDFSPHGHGNIRSRDFSPHMSPDRVTRNISPGRQKLREQGLEVKCSQNTVAPHLNVFV